MEKPAIELRTASLDSGSPESSCPGGSPPGLSLLSRPSQDFSLTQTGTVQSGGSSLCFFPRRNYDKKENPSKENQVKPALDRGLFQTSFPYICWGLPHGWGEVARDTLRFLDACRTQRPGEERGPAKWGDGAYLAMGAPGAAE